MTAPTILQKIVATKAQEVALAKSKRSLEDLEQKAKTHTPRGFAKALRQVASEQGKIGVISEIKKASPSKGIICQNFDPKTHALGYEKAGATCLSVLTDVQYFQGHDDYLLEARSVSTLPVLRKDFMIDGYQIVESAYLGADCILLIMACLDDEMVAKLHATALAYGLDVLIEMHDEKEVERALKLPQSPHNIYGINNRNLNTFAVDLQTSIHLAKILRQSLGETALIVTESGIHGKDDVHLMQAHNIHHFLIGEQFMKTDDAGRALEQLLKSI